MKQRAEQAGISEPEEAEAERRSPIHAVVVHEAITIDGEQELQRPSSALLWSGLAAGMSMTFSFIAEALIRSHLPDTHWRPLIASFGYTLGFLIVVLGRQQLFTENTLTVVLPYLARPKSSTFIGIIRVWTIVLLTNLAGVYLVTAVLGMTDVFTPHIKSSFSEIGAHAMSFGPWLIFLKGIFAGWLIALMVWLLPAAETAKVVIIVILIYFVKLGEFTHIIAGSAETFYLVTVGDISFGEYLWRYMLPTLVGNTLGGVSLVAVLNHAQVVAGKKRG